MSNYQRSGNFMSNNSKNFEDDSLEIDYKNSD
jgi:hypothetical protein